MYHLLLILHLIISVVLIILVLIQQGKGSEMGAAFGSGASATVFGSQGTGGFLFKLTGILLLSFFATSLLLSASLSYNRQSLKVNNNVLLNSEQQSQNTLPVPSSNQ
jgi:preprotein translocase subunit SecG